MTANTKQTPEIKRRVCTAAEQALRANQYVTLIEVLMNMGWLPEAHLKSWRYGKAPSLERYLLDIVGGRLRSQVVLNERAA